MTGPANGPKNSHISKRGLTGSGRADLGANSPAHLTNTAPYTWLKFMSNDGFLHGNS
jgi:hypothetical protein